MPVLAPSSNAIVFIVSFNSKINADLPKHNEPLCQPNSLLEGSACSAFFHRQKSLE